MASKKTYSTEIVPREIIESKIFLIRGKKVMLDSDLAKLYEVQTFRLNEAVKRNKKRFPDDFMFRLTKKEHQNLISQFAISSWGGRRKTPHAFTEHGILMLSSVLNSERAVHVNIQIMRTFTKLRKMLAGHKELKRKIEEMENKYDYQFKVVFKAIKELLDPPQKAKAAIGFRPH